MGKEKRVKLVKCPTIQEQLKEVEGADLVIVAYGYLTQNMLIKEYQSVRLRVNYSYSMQRENSCGHVVIKEYRMHPLL